MRVASILRLLAAPPGAGLAYLGLVRLGWCRHGASPMDPGFLHLGWLLHPTLPFWRSHAENLAMLAAGLAVVGWALLGLRRIAARARRPAADPPR